jgi:hypothetical protein
MASIRDIEEQLKGQAQQQKTAAAFPNAKAYYGDTCGVQAAPASAEQQRMHDLNRKANFAKEEHDKAVRALDILARHPEFHEFLQLLRDGLV